MLSKSLSRDQAWSPTGWRGQAACSNLDPSIFFPVGHADTAGEEVAGAKRICDACPVKQECLAFAIGTNQEYGVWGGTTEEERRIVRRSWRKAKAEAAAMFVEATAH
jgi:WhiB family redox-sensing transcriptional regulator